MGARFSAPTPPVPVLGPTQPPTEWVPGLSPWVKWPERGITYPSPSSAEVVAYSRVKLTFTFTN